MTDSSPSPPPTALSFAERDPRVALALAAAVAGLAFVAIRSDTFLNNEGIFTYLFAGMMADDPVSVLFFLKSRPPIAAFYALPSLFGFDAFAVVHALVAAAAVPLTAAVARAMGHARPNVAAAFVAGSALLVAAAASGVGNADGMTLAILATALLMAWKRPAWSGVVAAALPLARGELALLTLVLAGYAVFVGGRTRARFLVGLVVPIVIYVALGALYHEDLLWPVHHPPHVTSEVPYSVVMGRQMFGGAPHMATLNYFLLTPAVGLVLFLRPSSLTTGERALAVFLGAFVFALTILPHFVRLNFGDMPRYLLPALPFLALLCGRATEPLASAPSGAASGDARARLGAVAALGALLVVAHFQDASHAAPTLLWGVAGWSALALLAATERRRFVPAVAVVLSLVAGPALSSATRLGLRPTTVALGTVLIEHVDESPRVLTNVPELPLWLARNGGASIDIHHMVAADQRYEIRTLANERVGQDAAIVALMREHWYGPVVFEDEVREQLQPGTWLALRDDARTGHILQPEWLEGRSEVTEVEGGGSIVRIVEP